VISRRKREAWSSRQRPSPKLPSRPRWASGGELYVAAPEDAPHYAADNEDHEFVDEVESFPMGGTNNLHFETLWAITEGQRWDAKRHSFEWVGEPPEGQAHEWRFRFPPVFVARLAAMTPTDRARIANEWAKDPELDCDPEEVQPILESLGELAASAIATDRGLYLWGSL
jgi:hypothetical protein